MIEFLNHIDTQLFLFLNSFHNSFWDQVMFWISLKKTWYPLYLILISFFIWRYKWRSIPIFIFVALLITLSDQIASGLLKDWVHRYRPSNDPVLKDLVHIVNGYRGGTYGFASSHAANTFAMAGFTSLLLKNKIYTFTILFWAGIVSYSRIYLGVHYPGDLICGAFIGLLLAWLVFYLYQYTCKKYSQYFGRNTCNNSVSTS